MADEQATVKIVTVDAVTNLNELRETIANAKKALNEMSIGSEEYRQQLVELDKAQNLLKNAVNGTTAAEEDYQKALSGTSKTYNTMVKQLADLKKQMRNVDISTEEGKKEFDDLSKKIKVVADELKKLDADQGSHVRNVGNYVSHWEGFSDAVAKLPGPIGEVTNKVKGVSDSLALVGKQPVLGIITLLAPLIAKITEELKENKTAMDSVKKLMKALEPAVKVLEGALQKIAEWAGDALAGISTFVKGSLPQLKSFIAGVTGVGNAIFQFLIFPIKQTIEAVKGLGNILRDVFTGQWDKIKDDAKAAVKGLNDAFTKGIDFKGNYKAGEEAGEAFIDGLGSTKLKKKAKKAGKDLLAETLKGIQEEFDKDFDKMLDDLDKKNLELINKALEAEQKKIELARKREDAQLAGIEKVAKRQLEYNDILTENEEEKAKQAWEIQQLALERRLQAIAEFREKAMDRGDIERVVQYENEMADLQIEIEQSTLREKKRLREQDKKDALDTMNFFASATTGIMGNLADALENEGKSAKNIRIAAATIDMISGAVTAFSTAQQLGPIAGPIVGAVNAAAVIASGLTNIAKIRSTNVSADSAPTTTTPTVVSAPTVDTAVPTTTVVNGARTEAALNNAAKPQKVYLVESEAQAMGNHVQVVEDETSF